MKSLFGLMAFVFALLASAQPAIKFDGVDHDFGEILEVNGFAQHTFYFVNEGDKPITITKVKASCGCTTPGWTTEQVMPGDSGYVKARYNPRNRPGRFRKSLRITTTDPGSDQTLYIMGFVKPKPKTPEEEYPIAVGDFLVKYQSLNLGKINTKGSITKSFDIFNSSDSLAGLNKSTMILPDHISASLVPETLKSKELGKLVLTFDPIKKNDFGFVSDNIVLDTTSGQSLSVMAIIEEFFPEMTAEQLDEAPKLVISERIIEFGEVKSGEVVEASLGLSNTGKSKLAFRAIKSNCECITYKVKNKYLKKEKSQTLKLMFDTSEARGNQYKSITIYSNDPVNPVQLITLKGKVEK